MAVTQRWALPMPIFAAPGERLGLDDILAQMFGAAPANWTQASLYFFGEDYMAVPNFGYWPGGPKTAHSWVVNGAEVGELRFSAGNGSPLTGSPFAVQRANFSGAELVVGSAIGPLAQFVTGIQAQAGPLTNQAVYSMLVVDPALKAPTAGLRAPTPAEIVASAQRFDAYYGNIRNPDDCTWVAMALVGAAGATMTQNVQSLIPSQNEEGGFWRIAYRGSDPGQAADWTRLAQPGDVVRMGWNVNDGFHMFTVIEKLGPGALRVYDNNRPASGGITLGFHDEVNLPGRTLPGTITIYRLTTDNLYLINGSAESDRFPGTQFNDKMVGAGGVDLLAGWLGDDLLIGGAGADTLDGGDGDDIAQFAGRSADFDIAKIAGAWRVADLRAGTPEGTDTLLSVEVLKFTDQVVLIGAVSFQTQAEAAVANVLRIDPKAADNLAFVASLVADMQGGGPAAAMVDRVVQSADGTTAVAAMTYQFFLGFVPSGGGFDFLVSPTGPNPNNINSAYYQAFNQVNRFINFAANVGAGGEGRAAFEAEFGQLSLREATRKAYAEIFGNSPGEAKLDLLLDADVGNGLTRKDYFAVYGGDGLAGLGTKAAMVGFLLSAAAAENQGFYARSTAAYLSDLADGGQFQIDIIGAYNQPDWAYGG